MMIYASSLTHADGFPKRDNPCGRQAAHRAQGSAPAHGDVTMGSSSKSEFLNSNVGA